MSDTTSATSVAPTAVARERTALVAILTLALGLRLWGLDQNGWGAEYYSAAVRSMAAGARNFLFVAFDPAGFISVDKPPLALWIQVAFARLFGYAPASLLVPQAIAGTASVWVLYRMSRPPFGAHAALLAALFMALAPISVAVNRTNNMDTFLVLTLMLAAWSLLRACETGRTRALLGAMALVGVGFNVKMLAAFVVLPAFALAWLVRAPVPLARRVRDLALGCALLALVCLPWPLTVELTSPKDRPWVGSSQTNSMFELLVGHNGIGRFVAQFRSRAAGVSATARPASATSPETGSVTGLAANPAEATSTTSGGRGALARLFVRAPVGPLRLADGHLAAQFAWFAPFALAAFVPALARSGRSRVVPATKSALLLWGAWWATYTAVYSAAGGIMHFYYLSTLVPAVAALSGAGIVWLWRFGRPDRPRAGIAAFAALLAVTAAWQLTIEADALGWTPGYLLEHLGDWRGAIHAAMAVAIALAIATLLAASRRAGCAAPHASAGASDASTLPRIGATIGICALLILPTVWALSAVLKPAQGIAPSADLRRLDPDLGEADTRVLASFGRLPDTSRLVDYLRRHRAGERWLLSTTSTQVAAPIIIVHGEPVMARGGFHGLDPAIDVEALRRSVARGELRYLMLGDATLVSQRMGANEAQRPIEEWVRARGVRVDPSHWRTRTWRTRAELWDMNPDADFEWLFPP